MTQDNLDALLNEELKEIEDLLVRCASVVASKDLRVLQRGARQIGTRLRTRLEGTSKLQEHLPVLRSHIRDLDVKLRIAKELQDVRRMHKLLDKIEGQVEWLSDDETILPAIKELKLVSMHLNQIVVRLKHKNQRRVRSGGCV